jgi:glycosyltransferase involved in cell wall biosynthesis
MNKPLISVIIPLYNKEDCIKETVGSVLNQNFLDFELIIVDDGSTDNSISILQSFDDKRIKIISKPNGGVSDARNFGVKESKGVYIYFLDADDLMLWDCLSIFMDLINRYSNQDIFVSNFIVSSVKEESPKQIIKNIDFLINDSLKAFWTRKIFPRTGSILIRKTSLKKIVGFDKRMSMYEDLDFLIRLLKVNKTVYTQKVTFKHLLEYNALSKKIILLQSHFAYYIDLKDKKFYEKMLLCENIYAAYRKFKEQNQNENAVFLLKKNRKHIHYLLLMIVFRKYIGLLNKFNK